MQLFADDPNAIYRREDPPLPKVDGWQRGFTYLDFGDRQPDRLVKVDVLGPGPLVVHRLVGPDGNRLGPDMYGITLEPGGRLEHPGYVYFNRIEPALAMAERLGRLDLNWYEGDYPDEDTRKDIVAWWQDAHARGDVEDGAGLNANWPRFRRISR